MSGDQHAPSQSTGAPSVALYRPELDWLRFFAFLGVFLAHGISHEDPQSYDGSFFARVLAGIPSTISGAGVYGVDLFLALSAYLLTELLLRERARFGRVDVPAFYVRRALRIWPLYFAFILFCFLFDSSPALASNPGFLLSLVFFVGNWFFVFRGPVDCFAGPLWSISIEEQFYIVWPWLVRAKSVRCIAGSCIALLVIAFAVRYWLVTRHASHVQIWCNTLARLDPIVMGGILSIVLHRSTVRFRRWHQGCAALTGLGILLVLGYYRGFEGSSVMISYPEAAVAATLLIFACVANPFPSVYGHPVFRLLSYLGKISYGLYVFHILGLRLASQLAEQWCLRLAIAALITLALAAISYRFLEKPFLQLKKRYTYVASREA